jgi:hypothetical protein
MHVSLCICMQKTLQQCIHELLTIIKIALPQGYPTVNDDVIHVVNLYIHFGTFCRAFPMQFSRKCSTNP